MNGRCRGCCNVLVGLVIDHIVVTRPMAGEPAEDLGIGQRVHGMQRGHNLMVCELPLKPFNGAPGLVASRLKGNRDGPKSSRRDVLINVSIQTNVCVGSTLTGTGVSGCAMVNMYQMHWNRQMPLQQVHACADGKAPARFVGGGQVIIDRVEVVPGRW
jgi:hypothetical protein